MLILLNWSSYSQDITISEDQAREIIKDKRELIYSKVLIEEQGLLISSLESLRDSLRSQVASIRLSEQLATENYKSALERIKIIEDKKSPLILDILKGLGLVAVGFIVGSI